MELMFGFDLTRKQIKQVNKFLFQHGISMGGDKKFALIGYPSLNTETFNIRLLTVTEYHKIRKFFKATLKIVEA